jgi:hypothetical protein
VDIDGTVIPRVRRLRSCSAPATTQPHIAVDTDRRVFPYSVLETEGEDVPYRVGQLISD